MHNPLAAFVDACRQNNGAAAALDYQPFAAPFRSETPLNSAPYMFTLAEFRATFGHNAYRARIIDDAEIALAELTASGIAWQIVLVGGSFIRAGATPSDLDGLVVYTVDPHGAATNGMGLAACLKAAGSLRVDFKFCPADVHPAILIKRTSFFTSLFGYDRDTAALIHGTIMIVPDDVGIVGDRSEGMPVAASRSDPVVS